MTYCPDNDTSRFDRPATEIEITPAMIEAGARAIVFDHLADDKDVALRVLVSALRAGGYEFHEAT